MQSHANPQFPGYQFDIPHRLNILALSRQPRPSTPKLEDNPQYPGNKIGNDGVIALAGAVKDLKGLEELRLDSTFVLKYRPSANVLCGGIRKIQGRYGQ